MESKERRSKAKNGLGEGMCEMGALQRRHYNPMTERRTAIATKVVRMGYSAGDPPLEVEVEVGVEVEVELGSSESADAT